MKKELYVVIKPRVICITDSKLKARYCQLSRRLRAMKKFAHVVLTPRWYSFRTISLLLFGDSEYLINKRLKLPLFVDLLEFFIKFGKLLARKVDECKLDYCGVPYKGSWIRAYITHTEKKLLPTLKQYNFNIPKYKSKLKIENDIRLIYIPIIEYYEKREIRFWRYNVCIRKHGEILHEDEDTLIVRFSKSGKLWFCYNIDYDSYYNAECGFCVVNVKQSLEFIAKALELIREKAGVETMRKFVSILTNLGLFPEELSFLL